MAYQDPRITNALGKPVVESKQDFFVVFEGVSATEPEIIDRSSYKITYIVDGEGNISKPAQEQPSAYNILQNFTNDQTVTVILDQATTDNSTLGGQKTIFAIGKPVPYIYSQNGVGSGSYESRLEFRPFDAPPSGAYNALDSYIGNWKTKQAFKDDSTNFGYTSIPGYYPPDPNNYNYWDYHFFFKTGEPDSGSGASSGNYTIFDDEYVFKGWNRDPTYSPTIFVQNSQPSPNVASVTGSEGFYSVDIVENDLQYLELNVFVKGRSKITYPVDPYNQGWTENIDGKYAFYYQIGDSGSTDYETYKFDDINLVMNPIIQNYVQDTTFAYSGFQIVAEPPFNYSEGNANGTYLPYEVILTAQIPKTALDDNKKIRFLFAGEKIVSIGDDYSAAFEEFRFSINGQSPIPANYFVQNNVYWNRSGSGKYIESTTGLGNFYGQYYLPTTTQFEFGFDEVSLPFEILPGDKIRFQYNPQQVFTIYEVQSPAQNDGKVKLLLDRRPDNDELANFVIYRIDDSLANNIILNVKKNITIGDPENPFTGIILPQYPSDKIEDNTDKILEQLKADGIIKN